MIKIDESCINHNAVRLIEELTSNAYAFCDASKDGEESENRNYMIMTLGNITGVLDMARAMKEALKA